MLAIKQAKHTKEQVISVLQLVCFESALEVWLKVLAIHKALLKTRNLYYCVNYKKKRT